MRRTPVVSASVVSHEVRDTTADIEAPKPVGEESSPVQWKDKTCNKSGGRRKYAPMLISMDGIYAFKVSARARPIARPCAADRSPGARAHVNRIACACTPSASLAMW